MSETTRAYIYRILVAAAPLAAAYGLVTNETLALWLALAAAVLGTGLAAANTATKPESSKRGRHVRR